MILRTILISFLFALSPVSNAADWILLQNDSLIGDSPGFDLLWDTDDDFYDIAGLNPAGAATAYGETTAGTSGFFLGGFGFLTGTTETNSSGAQNFGVNTISASTIAGVYDNNFLDEGPITQNLSAPGTVTLNQNNTTTASYVLNQPDPLNIDTTSLSVTSFGSWITPDDNPEVLFVGDDLLIGHYAFLRPLLPAGWTALATSADFYTIASTNQFLNGVQGVTSLVMYSMDPNAVPAPVPIPAMLPMFLLALGGLWRQRRRIIQ